MLNRRCHDLEAFSLSSREGGEGQGEEAVVIESPLSGSLPARSSRREREHGRLASLEDFEIISRDFQRPTLFSFSFVATVLLAFNVIFSGCASPGASSRNERQPKLTRAQLARLRITVTRTNYHGWTDSLLMSNGKVEAVIVPAIGQVMQFRFAGESDGPFWENRALDGKSPDPKSREWGNFGGDKTWPSPQADWPKITPRGWPPPQA